MIDPDPTSPAPPRRTRLTASQQLIWVRQRLAPGVPLYDAPCTFMLEGEVDEVAFVRAFSRLVATTDAMRFVVDDSTGEPVATVREQGLQPCDFVDLSATPEIFEEWLEARLRRPPDPSICLYDAALIRLGAERYCWFLSTHHLITDGWNLLLLFRRQEVCYCAERDGGSVQMFPSFVDYIDSERIYMESAAHLKHTQWWETRTARAHRGSKFYAGRVSDPGARHTRVVVPLGDELSAKLHTLSAAAGFRGLTTDLGLFNVFTVALLAWYWRIESEDSMCIGVTSHGRATQSHRETAGLFMQQLPFQIEIESQDDFQALAKRVARVGFEFFAHAMPAMVSPRAQKCFDVTLNYIPASFGNFDGMPTTMTWRHNGYGDPERRLGITVHDFNDTGSFELLLDFNDAAFTSHARESTIRHLLMTFDAMTADPASRIDRFKMLSEAEQGSSVKRLTAGPAACRSDKTLWSMFETVAEKVPDRPAVFGPGFVRSFAELHSDTNVLAGQLREAGVKAGDIVPLIAGRQAETLPAILAIEAVGAAFLPLDPALPEARRQWLLDDAGAAIVIEMRNDAPKVAEFKPRRVRGQGDPGFPPGAAYVLYTSGSTGEPNGVVVGHGSVINLLETFERLAPLGPDARCAWWTNIGFDVAIYEIFSAVLYGRTLVVPAEGIRLVPQSMFEWLFEENISGAYLPPFFLAEFARWLEHGRRLSLRRLLVGVEAIPQQRLATILRKLPELCIINGYGPTEATVCATLHQVDMASEETGPAPIGRPVPGSHCYLLDRHGNVVPDGVAGDLHIGGASLALGYFRRDELNRQRFVTDPLNRSVDSFFRTGDGVRLREDGALEFVGRLDDQIKIHGERIEPGEIKQVMLEFPGIVDCLVMADDASRPGGERTLLAWYVANAAVDVVTLKTFLRHRLPLPMVPSMLIEIDVIPRNINGKPDPSSLPTPKRIRNTRNTAVAPRSDTERIIADIWSDLLDVERVSITEDFIDLGGESLLAASVVARINETFGIDLPISKAFEASTVEVLGALVESTLIDQIDQLSEDEARRLSDLGRAR